MYNSNNSHLKHQRAGNSSLPEQNSVGGKQNLLDLNGHNRNNTVNINMNIMNIGL